MHVQFFMPKKTTAKAIASCIRHPFSPISNLRPTPNATCLSLSDFVGY
jgi:hypothetical protein